MRLLDLLVPPLCAICGRAASAGRPLCRGCGERLARSRTVTLSVPGIDEALALGAHEGPAGEIVRALKFKRRLPVARVAAERLAAEAPASPRALVPVPASPIRHRARGFDPAGEIALALGRLTHAPVLPLLRRVDRGRQRGRPRRSRLADPPVIEAIAGPPPPVVTVVDDVVTTGATLAACAVALRGAGCARILALAVARA